MYVAFDTLLRSLRRHGYDVTCVHLRAVCRAVALACAVRSRRSRVARRTRARSYVRNFTDVDDKIIRRAAEVRAPPLALALSSPPLTACSRSRQLSVPCDELTERFIAEFHADIAALRCLPPNLEPRATAHVPDIVALIQRIIANGHAYALAGGDVYFEVASLPGYGRLSRRGDEDNRAGERVAVDDRKRGAADFALWKVRLCVPRARGGLLSR